MKDKRFIAVKSVIETGRVTMFRQIFDFLPMKAVYVEMGINYARFKRLLEHPANLTITEITTLSNLFEIDLRKFIELVLLQIEADKKSKKKR